MTIDSSIVLERTPISMKRGRRNRRIREAKRLAHIMIIGSGIAGLFAANRLADAGHTVTVVTKQRTKDSSTNWAQGGIAAILDAADQEGINAHIDDTLASGDGACDEAVVRSVIHEAAPRIHDLIALGVQFQPSADGGFALAQEGGHSEPRILHAKDTTGREIERALAAKAESHPNIRLRTNTLAIDLIQRVHGSPAEGVAGAWCLDQISDEVVTLSADAVVLATGGVGQLWAHTTNPSVATGDGLAMGYRTGACVKDMAFIQFHPTALHSKRPTPFLITEALRGEGAVLMNSKDLDSWRTAVANAIQQRTSPPSPHLHSFTLQHSEHGSMATRDIVARAIDRELTTSGEDHVWLVTEHLNTEHLQEQFPNIAARLNSEGLRLGVDPIPVLPAAHYMVGGLDVDDIGRAQLREEDGHVPHLYAIGEVACTGMHGANRLASNSLLEAVVYAARVAEHLIAHPPATYRGVHPPWRAEGLDLLVEHAPLLHDRRSLLTTMTREVGIVRTHRRLRRAKRRLALLGEEIAMMWRTSLPDRDIIELRNLALVGQLVVESAIYQPRNVGLHHNLDLIMDDMPE